MTPEQLRTARAALNWSLDDLAKAAGVHRNTISNFETIKYAGDPEKLAAIQQALESAGVIFIQGNGEDPGVRLRRFRVGDIVRFRDQTRVRLSFDIAADEVGTVIGVEPHPPPTGPTYRIQVQFSRALVPYTFKFEYELVKAAPDAGTISQERLITDPKAIVEHFCTLCTEARTHYDLYRDLFESDPHNLHLYSIAPLFFEDLCDILKRHVSLQFCKITDPARTGKKANLTTNYILEEISWPDDIRHKLVEFNERLKVFRQYLEPARSKRIAHADFHAQTEQSEPLGIFPKGADEQFLENLQMFVNVAYGYFHQGQERPIVLAMSTDTHQLLKALQKSVVFDNCSKCDEAERAMAFLDYQDQLALRTGSPGPTRL
jgi:transcriptional regulator with XRE-family HTH domain